jgi:hypothetical protein
MRRRNARFYADRSSAGRAADAFFTSPAIADCWQAGIHGSRTEKATLFDDRIQKSLAIVESRIGREDRSGRTRARNRITFSDWGWSAPYDLCPD